MTSPTLLTSLQQASAAAPSASAAAATPMSTIRLTMPQQARQRSPAAAGMAAAPQVPAQVLKVMGTQPGSIPQIITLSSPRAVSVMVHSFVPTDRQMILLVKTWYT